MVTTNGLWHLPRRLSRLLLLQLRTPFGFCLREINLPIAVFSQEGMANGGGGEVTDRLRAHLAGNFFAQNCTNYVSLFALFSLPLCHSPLSLPEKTANCYCNDSWKKSLLLVEKKIPFNNSSWKRGKRRKNAIGRVDIFHLWWLLLLLLLPCHDSTPSQFSASPQSMGNAG